MQARGMLMIEHRLIERMIDLIEKEISRIENTGSVDTEFIDTAVDFIRTYADRTHHGKEEDIMFRDLEHRPLSPEDRQIMDDLISEHVFARNTTQTLVEAAARYRNGAESSLPEIVSQLRVLVNFYPKHIEKEDTVFFPAARSYLSDDEDEAMIRAFRDFDQRMVHTIYQDVISELEKDQ